MYNGKKKTFYFSVLYNSLLAEQVNYLRLGGERWSHNFNGRGGVRESRFYWCHWKWWWQIPSRSFRRARCFFIPSRRQQWVNWNFHTFLLFSLKTLAHTSADAQFCFKIYGRTAWGRTERIVVWSPVGMFGAFWAAKWR